MFTRNYTQARAIAETAHVDFLAKNSGCSMVQFELAEHRVREVISVTVFSNRKRPWMMH